MRDMWEVKFDSHHIRVESTWTNQKLWVDGVLQDEQLGPNVSSRLFGKVKNEEGEDEKIKVSIGMHLFKRKCRIFIGEQLVYTTDIKWES